MTEGNVVAIILALIAAVSSTISAWLSHRDLKQSKENGAKIDRANGNLHQRP